MKYNDGLIHRVVAMVVQHGRSTIVPPALCGANLPPDCGPGCVGPLVTTAAELVTCPICIEASP